MYPLHCSGSHCSDTHTQHSLTIRCEGGEGGRKQQHTAVSSPFSGTKSPESATGHLHQNVPSEVKGPQRKEEERQQQELPVISTANNKERERERVCGVEREKIDNTHKTQGRVCTAAPEPSCPLNARAEQRAPAAEVFPGGPTKIKREEEE